MSHYDPTTRTWHGPRRPPVLNPAASVGQVIVNALERTPEQVVQIDADTGEEYSCDKLRIQMIRVGLNLVQEFGISKGDIVCLISDNRSCITSVVFGCFLIGAPVHTLDASFKESDLAHMMGLTKPKLVFCTELNYLVVKNSIQMASFDATIIVLDGTAQHQKLFTSHPSEKTFRPDYMGDSDKTVAVIVCSSGTTGVPKAVCMTHAQLIAPYALSSSLLTPCTMLSFSSLYWISAFQMLMITILNGFRRITTARTFSPECAYELIQKYEVTNMFAPPPMLAELVEYCERKALQMSPVRIFGSGGSVLPEALKQRANALLPNGRVMVGYAMSETGGIMALDLFEKPNSAGALMPNVSMRIANDEGVLLGPDEQGEIQIRYVHPFAGYYGNEEATRALLTADGFIQSGDVGYFDRAGFLYITDRKKEILRFRNHQVAPAQLEALLAEIPGVSQAVVVGRRDPVPPHDDLVTALVVVKDGERRGLSEEAIVEYVNGKVSDHKRLRGGVIFVPAVPKTANGKVDRREAKRMASLD